MSAEPKTTILKDVPMMPVDPGRCTLVLALQTALKFLGQAFDYDYLMGLSGAGYLFYANPEQPAVIEWCEAMRERWLHIISDAVGIELRLAEGDRTLFDSDPEKHFYAQFGKAVTDSLDSRRPCLAYSCFEGPQWDIISGFSGGRLLCRSIHNPISPSGLIERIQPYEYNTLWPSRVIVLGQEKTVCPRADLIRRSIEVCFEIGRGLTDGEGNRPLTGPSALGVWADVLQKEHNHKAMKGHQQLRRTLIDSRISLERFLRWVQAEVGQEFGPDVHFARKHFAKSFEILMSIDISDEAMAQEASRLKIADDIRSLEETEARAFGHLERVHEGMKKTGSPDCGLPIADLSAVASATAELET